jgi:methionine synthase I (cobalamin-dependent)
VAPFGRITPPEARDAFRTQIDALVEGGVDVLIPGTFTDFTELLEAVRAAREVCDLPVIAQMSFTEDARTRYGHVPAEVVASLEGLGVGVMGANCSVGPVPMPTAPTSFRHSAGTRSSRSWCAMCARGSERAPARRVRLPGMGPEPR